VNTTAGDRGPAVTSRNAGHEAAPWAAMDLAAQAANRVHAPDILAGVAGDPNPPAETEPGVSSGIPGPLVPDPGPHSTLASSIFLEN